MMRMLTALGISRNCRKIHLPNVVIFDIFINLGKMMTKCSSQSPTVEMKEGSQVSGINGHHSRFSIKKIRLN